jgi:hypothetical protein
MLGFMMTGSRLATLLFALVVGCSGSSDGAAPAPASHQAAAPADEAPPSPDEKLRSAQESAVAAVCERLVDCAVEAGAMTPEEVQELEAEGTVRRFRDKCEAEGAQSELSPRQIKIVQRCVNDARACDELQTCLEEAKKKDAEEAPTSSR